MFERLMENYECGMVPSGDIAKKKVEFSVLLRKRKGFIFFGLNFINPKKRKTNLFFLVIFD